MPKTVFLLVIALTGIHIAIAQQQPPPKNYSKAELRALNDKYEDLQKELSAIQKDRQQVENALKAYDSRLKSLGDAMQKTEEQIDFASGTYSYDPNFSTTTQQVRTIEISFNLKTIDLLSEIQREHNEFIRAGQAIAAKYDYMKRAKSADR